MTDAWILPDGVEEWLPPDSWAAEALRRELLDAYRQRGYGLVQTPIVEHLSTLLSGAGSDLEDQTFKFVDPASGRLLGLRADMTPQAARIAARRYPDGEAARLCYLGTVLRTHPEVAGGARAIRQAGCELFGEAGVEADLEILDTMLQTLAIAGLEQVHLDLGHVGVYRSIVADLSLAEADESQLFEILQRKSQPGLSAFAGGRGLSEASAAALSALMAFSGSLDMLPAARERLAGYGEAVLDPIDSLQAIAARVRDAHPGVEIHLDLAELRGYRYQTGLIFAAYAPGHGREVARGGRYDGIGERYGRSLPATGFSADLNELLRLGSGNNTSSES